METLKVLITDDEPGMRLGAERALRNFTLELPDIGEQVAFETSCAETGEQALEMIGAARPDILLLDHKLPGMSGLEVLDRITGNGSAEMHTVMITAYASLDTAVSAIKKGAFDFLAKPFTPRELRDKVTKASHSLIMARQARKLAAEKRQVRFKFISVLAHELKSPLSAVEGYLYLLRDQPEAIRDREQLAGLVSRCLVRTDQMKKLIVDLLEMTRIESGRKKRELESVDLAGLARQAVETALPDAESRGIAVETDAPDSLLMKADRGELNIILNNLLSNAVKYNTDGGRVGLAISREGDAVRIEVSDTGIGMSQEEVKKLFGEFVRIKNEKTRDILGSGLGLSIVKKLVSLYDGGIAVDSTPGEGTTFTATLREPDAAQEQEEQGQ